jgi:hypothetical protein
MSLPSMAGRAQSRLKLGLNDYRPTEPQEATGAGVPFARQGWRPAHNSSVDSTFANKPFSPARYAA